MIIYTTITNAYDRIPDHYYDPDVKYVLFYDEDIEQKGPWEFIRIPKGCLLYTSPSPRDRQKSRMPSSA